MTSFRVSVYLWLITCALALTTMLSVASADTRNAQGEAILTTGEVWLISSQTNERVLLQRGQPIHEGDHLESEQGAATLRMSDNAILSIHPFSNLYIRNYDVETGHIRVELNQGRLDAKTGDANRSNRAGYRLNTPFAALGIRGTEYSAVLNDEQLDIYVHSGEIVLSPFSLQYACDQDGFGPCENPLSATLEAGSGTWLQLINGESIRRIRGTPQFIETDLEQNTSSPLPRDTLFNALGKVINPDSSLHQSLQDPLINLIDKAPLPQQPALPDNNDQIQVEPTTDKRYYTDLSNINLSEEAYRNLLRRITLRSYAYSTLGQTKLYNFEANLFPVRSTSLWVDTTQQRLWGQDVSLDSLFDSRFWPEGRNLWLALPNNLERMGAENLDWFNQVRDNTADLWRLPLSSQAIYFTPQYQLDSDYTSQRYASVWSQPVQTQNTTLSAATSQPSSGKALNIRELTLSPGNDFKLTLTQGSQQHEIKGKSDTSGILFASNDQFSVRGHWHKDSIIMIIEDLQTGQLSMNGLASVGSGTQQISEWTERNNEPVSWGHWSNFAKLSEQQLELVQEILGENINNNHFALAIPDATRLPTQGQYGFNLTGYEAVYAQNGTLLPAEISNARLTANFADQSLNTRFDITAPHKHHSLRFEATGHFDAQGRLEAFNPNSQAQASGYIGAQGHQATFLFDLPIDQHSYYSGITHWQR